MLEDARYIDEVWGKYNDYLSGKIQDDFYETRVYKNTDYFIALKTVAMFIVAFITTVGVVYAGIAVYNNYKQNKITEKHLGDLLNTMSYSQEASVYYQTITTYEEYNKYKEVWKNLPDVTEEEFKDNFVIIIKSENSITINTDIKNVYVDDNNIYMDIEYNKNNKDDSNIVTTILPIEQYRENVVIKRIYEKIGDKEYTPLEELKSNYSKEEAVKDGCIVFYNDKNISNNLDKLDNFVEKSKNGEECFIRVARYYEIQNYLGFHEEIIIDVIYKNGKYSVGIKQNNKENVNRIEDYSNLKIAENVSEKLYILSNISGKQFIICKIK